jgi:transposase
MSQLHQHYALLLGLNDAWNVATVNLSLEAKRVEIALEHRASSPLACPECGESCPLADHAPERTWRHLDTMQFETLLRARLPRVKCAKCGVKTCIAPWAEPYSRFTLLFECFVIDVLQACGTVKAAATLVGLDWKSVQAIMQRAVERGLCTRTLTEVKAVGIDEKSFGRGHDYVSVMTDITNSRVLEVVPDRDEQGANALWASVGPGLAQKIEAVAMDMWPAYAKSAASHAPQAEIVHDRFYVSKHLNEAVDQVRRQENKTLLKEGDERLKGSRQLWLFNPENLSEERGVKFAALKEETLKTSRAWAIKEQFRGFWEYTYAGNAKKFFKDWYGWASRCQLKPVIKVAKMLKKHLPGLLSYFRHAITNATSEGFNSKIQHLKSAARGFRNFAHFRTRILFFCGKLELKPHQVSH